MRPTTTTAALMVAIVLALLLPAMAAWANHAFNWGYEPIPGATDGADRLTGTSADNIWIGSPGKDTIYGKGGDDLIGSEVQGRDWGWSNDVGADTYYGGRGEDILEGNRDGKVDTIDCGPGGEDLASFERGPATSPQTTVSDKVNKNTCERRDWTAKELKDCAVKPWDNADVQCKTGTEGSDELLGNNDPDILVLDVMWGEGGNDTLRGRRGFDGLDGGAGEDTLYGGLGDDTLYGEFHGRDEVGDADKVYGGDGDDRIDVSELQGSDPPSGYTPIPDTISCGAGDHDWAVIDSGIDQDPQGVTLTADRGHELGEHGQSGCEYISEETDFRYWWWLTRR